MDLNYFSITQGWQILIFGMHTIYPINGFVDFDWYHRYMTPDNM